MLSIWWFSVRGPGVCDGVVCPVVAVCSRGWRGAHQGMAWFEVGIASQVRKGVSDQCWARWEEKGRVRCQLRSEPVVQVSLSSRRPPCLGVRAGGVKASGSRHWQSAQEKSPSLAVCFLHRLSSNFIILNIKGDIESIPGSVPLILRTSVKIPGLYVICEN